MIDNQEFTELFEAHQKDVNHWLVEFEADPELRAELVQDTFAAVWESRESFNGDSTFRTWLNSIAVNVGRNHQRRLSRWPELVMESDLDREHESGDLESSWIEANVTDCDDPALIYEAESTALPVHLEALVVMVAEGHTQEEIAEASGFTQGYVSQQLAIARALMEGE